MMLRRAVGYILHPSIQRKLPSSPAVAELATGTGAFLVDLAATLPPTARLDAYDISADSFLPKSELPANVTLNLSDARAPPKDDLKGLYDVVCIRFLNAGLTPEDWAKVANHAWQLLKLGGVLQWIEGDLTQLAVILRSEPESKTDAWDRALRQGATGRGPWSWFVTNLTPILEEQGFKEVKQMASTGDRVDADRKPGAMLVAGAICNILKMQTQKGAEGAFTMDQIDATYKEMEEEVQTGAYSRCDFHQFVAWKPA